MGAIRQMAIHSKWLSHTHRHTHFGWLEAFCGPQIEFDSHLPRIFIKCFGSDGLNQRPLLTFKFSNRAFLMSISILCRHFSLQVAYILRNQFESRLEASHLVWMPTRGGAGEAGGGWGGISAQNIHPLIWITHNLRSPYFVHLNTASSKTRKTNEKPWKNVHEERMV